VRVIAIAPPWGDETGDDLDPAVWRQHLGDPQSTMGAAGGLGTWGSTDVPVPTALPAVAAPVAFKP